MAKVLRWLGFHIHEWGKWQTGMGGYKATNEFTIQWRECKACGKKEWERMG